MKYCKECGTEIIKGASYCQKCGNKIFLKKDHSISFLKVAIWIKSNVAIVFVLFFVALIIYSTMIPSCSLPIRYGVGNIDPRFKISNNEAVQIIEKSMDKWNKGMGKDMFQYDSQSALKIDLIYDNRQLALDRVKSRNSELQYSSDSINTLKSKLENQIYNYQADLDQLNSDVDYWNMRGGAPSYEYYRLQSEQASLESRRNSINNLADSLDYKIDIHNNNLQNLKNELEKNKDKIETEGEYLIDSQKINIYTFGNKDELELIIMHELGHSIGVNHAQDPKSIMYYLLNSQDTSNLRLSQEDINLVKTQCGLK